MDPRTERRDSARRASMPPACEACRRLKMRCTRVEHAAAGAGTASRPCDRCARVNRPCNIPQRRRLGRKPGSLGRHRGMTNEKTASSQSVASLASVAQPVSAEQESLPASQLVFPGAAMNASLQGRSDASASIQSRGSLEEPLSSLENLSFSPFASGSVEAGPLESKDSRNQATDYTVSDPMSLLADAEGQANAGDEEKPAEETCTLSTRTTVATEEVTTTQSAPKISDTASSLLRRPGYVSLGLDLDRNTLERALDTLISNPRAAGHHANYFKPPRLNPALDLGPDLDPVDLDLVSMTEVHHLFPIYFKRLHPLHGILDPSLHTPSFVRSRSALLFTWILVVSAQFDHASAAIAKRLRLHGEKLLKHVHAQGYKSVEIVQGYYISLLCAVPTTSLAEERSWVYTAQAFGMASALGLDRPPRPTAPHKPGAHENSTTTTSTAGINSTETTSKLTASSGSCPTNGAESTISEETGQRLARNRERTWLRIALWEQAHSAACGRVRPFPETDLTTGIEEWWQHPLANQADAYTCAFILLRRHLAELHYTLNVQPGCRSGQHSRRVIDVIDSVLNPWRVKWLLDSTPPLSAAVGPRDVYLRYVFFHGRLLTLCFALGARSGRAEAMDAEVTRRDCFEAAVHCCEMAVRDMCEIGEPMYCMLAPTWIMISFAAMLTLKLFPQLFGDRPGQEMELLALLAELAIQLERAGTVPQHRLGIAALLGQHLFRILRAKLAALKPVASIAMKSIPASTCGAETASAGLSMDMMVQPQMMHDTWMPYSFDMATTSSLSPMSESLAQDAFSGFMQEWYGQGTDSIFESVANIF